MPFMPLSDYLLTGIIGISEMRPFTKHLMSDQYAINFIVCVALSGMLGLLFGYLLSTGKVINKKMHWINKTSFHDLKMSNFSYVVILSLLIITHALSFPSETIFSNTYMNIRSEPGTLGIDRSSGLILSIYLFVLCLWVDCEKHHYANKIKLYAIILSIFIIVFMIELPRGERTSIGMIIGAFALYITYPFKKNVADIRPIGEIIKKRFKKVLVPLFTIYILFFLLADFRGEIHERDYGMTGISHSLINSYKGGTWVGALLSTLGLADEYVHKNIEYLLGSTYLQYIASLPPSPLAKLFDYKRPLDKIDVDPGVWYEGYTVGGLHPTVVPFKNFGILGVITIFGIFGYMIGKIELLSEKYTFWSRYIYAATFAGAVHWFWYGDIYIIRVYMVAFFLGWFYKVFLLIESGSVNKK
jgi:oligosaccharide repeat unit polymerase